MQVIEEPRRNRRRWTRALAAIVAATGAAAGCVAIWEYARRAGDAAVDLSGLLLIGTVAHFAGRSALRRRKRRVDLRWESDLVLPGGVSAGLTARWSRAGLAVRAVAAGGFLLGGPIFLGKWVSDGFDLPGVLAVVAVGGIVVVVARSVFGRLRWSGCVAVIARGVAARGRLINWDQISAVHRDDDGVHLQLRGEEKPVTVGGPDCAVADERLVEVIEFYRVHPHRRSALDTGPGWLLLPSGRDHR
nr:hypothetical protein [Micromonospora sp. DSM 115978]